MTRPESSSSSSSCIDGNMLSYLTLVLDVIESRDWVRFDAVAVQHPRAFRALSAAISSSEEFNGMTLLHAVVRNDPPPGVVAAAVDICPAAAAARDCLGRTPLHVAAGVGAAVESIRRLCAACPEACKVQDEDGRTPLHMACDADCRLFEERDERRRPPSIEAVCALLSASLAPVSMEDLDEMSPLEYAILSDSDERVVKLLQKAAQKFMKSMHAKGKECEPCGGRSRRQPGAPPAAA